MLLPIGRDEAEIRRHAWVSYTILALNVAIFVVIGIAEREPAKELEAAWSTAVEYHVARPYLKTPESMVRLIGADGVAYFERLRREFGPMPIDHVREEQRRLDAYAAHAERLRREGPSFRFAYVPAEGNALTLITSMFLHAGFLHLIGNLLYLFLSGPFVEDVYGRPLFAVLYFGGGLAATITYAARHTDSVIPAMGASGAIAAVMGAYLVRFARSKIELLFIPLLYRPTWHFRFWMPAFVVLPLWFVQQLWGMSGEAQSGVGFSAHVGGFAFGVVFALAMKVASVEERFIHPVIVNKTTWSMDERLVRAIAARDQRDAAQAQRELASFLRDGNPKVEMLHVALDVARDTEDVSAFDAIAARLLARHTEANETELAADLIREVTSDRQRPLPKFLSRAAPIVERSGDRAWALTLYERLHDTDPSAATAVPRLMKIATLRHAQGDIAGAREALSRARQHPACSAEWATAIESRLAQFASATRQTGRSGAAGDVRVARPPIR